MGKKKGDYFRRQSGPNYGKHGKGFSNKDYNGGKKHKKGKNFRLKDKNYGFDRVVEIISIPGKPYEKKK